MAEWYCHAGGGQLGPLDDAHVRAMARAGQLRPEDLVWREGMAEWASAGRVPGLFEAAPAAATAAAGTPLRTGNAAPIAYASAPVQPLPALSSVTVADDPGPFHKVGSQFKVRDTKWQGSVFASPRAIYLVKAGRANTGAGGHGGLLLILLVAAFRGPGDDLRTCTVEELPDSVRGTLDPKGKLGAKDVIVFNRGAVRQVRKSGFNNLLAVEIGEDRARIHTPLFRGKAIKAFLAQHDWPVDRLDPPTEGPIYGLGLNRTALNPGPAGPGVLKRLIFVLIAVAIVGLIIFLSTIGALDSSGR